MSALPVTSLYAALLGLFLIPITMRVGLRRLKTNINLGLGDDETLLRCARAHANFLEHVPMALILLALTELGGASAVYIHSLGACLVIARLMHYFTIITTPMAVTRAIGMLGTFAVYIGTAGWLLYNGYIVG